MLNSKSKLGVVGENFLWHLTWGSVSFNSCQTVFCWEGICRFKEPRLEWKPSDFGSRWPSMMSWQTWYQGPRLVEPGIKPPKYTLTSVNPLAIGSATPTLPECTLVEEGPHQWVCLLFSKVQTPSLPLFTKHTRLCSSSASLTSATWAA